MARPIDERFWEKVERGKTIDCWLWKAAVFPTTGYGAFRVGGREGRTVTAHRVAYELTFGELPPGQQVHHDCRVRLCVNPMHLRAVTPSQHNILDPRYHGKRSTHCKRGHEYTPENSILYVNKAGYVCRSCKTCQSESSLRYRKANREKINERQNARRSGH